MRLLVGVQGVRQRVGGDVVRAVHRQAVDEVEVRVVRPALLDDPRELLADRAQGEPAGRDLRGVARRREDEAALAQRLDVDRARPGRVLVDGAEDRRHDEQRRRRMALADRVEEAVERRPEDAAAHQVAPDDVDADLEAQQVGVEVAHRAGDEGVEDGRAAEAEVDEVEPGGARGDDGPGAGGTDRVAAVADRAAVVHPARAVGARHRGDGSVRAQRHELDTLLVRQPQLDGLLAGGQREAHGAGAALGEGRGARRDVGGQQVALRHDGAVRHLAVDDEVDLALRPCRRAGQRPAGDHRVELDGLGRGPQHEAHTRRLALVDREHRVGVLGPGPRRQPVRAQAAVGRLELDGAVHEVGGQGDGLESGHGAQVHHPSPLRGCAGCGWMAG